VSRADRAFPYAFRLGVLRAGSREFGGRAVEGHGAGKRSEWLKVPIADHSPGTRIWPRRITLNTASSSVESSIVRKAPCIPVIEVSGVRKTYGKTVAVEEASLRSTREKSLDYRA